MRFTHRETVPGGERIAPDAPVNAPPGVLLYPRYDLEGIAGNVTAADIGDAVRGLRADRESLRRGRGRVGP